jgi:glutamate formiminotransferase/glutamate formiminotransferase/formiminotetrahydrofolate cyclodeaminase
MNLTDYRVTSMYMAFQAVKAEAAKRGVELAGSELIGLVPQAALYQGPIESLLFERFDPTEVLETRMARVVSMKDEKDLSLSGFLDAVAAAKPTPAGGSVAALVGALAASLGVLGARLGHQTETERCLIQLSQRLHQLVQEDIEAYEGLSEAYKIPKHHPDRPKAIAVALHKATEVPLEIAELACETGWLIHASRKSAASALNSDLTVGIIMAIAAAEAGLHTAQVNVKAQTNQQLTGILFLRIRKTGRSLEELKGLCYTPPPSK